MPTQRTDSIQVLTGFPPSVKNVPANWPVRPTPDKISLLFNFNSQNIYHKFNPYTIGDNPFGIIPNRQPFVYRYPDEAKQSFFEKIPPSVKTLANVVGLNQPAVDDVVRISRFLLTSTGVLFLIKQGLMQSQNAFPETSLYNPLETIVATVSPLSLGLIGRPKRYIDLTDPLGIFGIGSSNSGGLLSGVGNLAAGAVRAAVQSSANVGLSALAGGSAKPSPLRSHASSIEFAGITRIPTANRARQELNKTWRIGSLSSQLSGIITAAVDSFIPSLVPRKNPPGINYTQDEKTYDAMTGDQLNYLVSYNVDGSEYSATQRMRFNGSLDATVTRTKSVIIPIGTGQFTTITLSAGRPGKSINNKPTGYPLKNNTSLSNLLSGASSGQIALNTILGVASQFGIGPGKGSSVNPAAKYQDVIGIDPHDNTSFLYSDVLANYANYINDNGDSFISRLSTNTGAGELSVKLINKTLQNVIQRIKDNTGGRYAVLTDTYSRLMSSGQITDPTQAGYGRISSIDIQSGASKKSYGVTSEYATKFGVPKTVDVSTSNNTLRIATSFISDGINQLPVLKGDKKINSNSDLSAMYPGWTKWDPDKDDLIAFYFYDVVNNKYIPFRATVKGISEGNTAFWDELRFIGRADQLYSYNGFSRTLSFTFNIVINSISELLPTWKKINYLAGIVKPANYTASDKFNNVYSKFIVPPMFMVTIGDLYKFQPMVVTSININVPDDASWETLNENNSSRWSFLNGIITAPNVGKKYAQVPREVEISITSNLLEKERAIIGSSHFGHAPHTDQYEDGVFDTGNEPVEYLPTPTEFSRDIIEFNPLGTLEPINNSSTQVIPSTSNNISTIPTNNPTTAGSHRPLGLG